MEYFAAPERLVTPTFTVRSYMPGEGPLVNEASASSYEHLRTFMPWARPDPSQESSEDFCRRCRGKYLLNEDFVMGIFSPTGDRLLGGTGFHLRGQSLDQRKADIGMWIRADAAGQGLGTAVLVAMLRWGFDAWPWLRLTWHCDTRNAASARTAEKAGMLLEGTHRSDTFGGSTTERHDIHVFAALHGEWTAPAER